MITLGLSSGLDMTVVSTPEPIDVQSINDPFTTGQLSGYECDLVVAHLGVIRALIWNQAEVGSEYVNPSDTTARLSRINIGDGKLSLFLYFDAP